MTVAATAVDREKRPARAGRRSHLTTSVIIPTYNRAPLLAQAIESALRQSRVPDEIVVVDDGSTDETPQLLEAYGAPVRVIRQPNRGVSEARNHGLAVATGDVIVFLDSDDVLLPDCLARTVGALEEFPDVGVVYPDWYLIDRAGGRLGLCSQIFKGNRPSGRVLGAVGCDWFMISMSSATVRRTALRDLGFDRSLSLGAEDLDFWRRLAARTEFLYLDEALACVRRHGAQLTTTCRVQSLAGVIEVQRRIMAMAEFNEVAPRDKARLYCVHGVKLAESGRCDLARRFFWRSVRTAPSYRVAYPLLGLSLLGGSALRYVITRRREMLGRQMDATSKDPVFRRLARSLVVNKSRLPAEAQP